jgi:tRNA threonylcarbamoyladenosine biosynthesis protein TsaB
MDASGSAGRRKFISRYNRAMQFVAFETSGEWCSVALWRDGEISAIEARAQNSHGEFALPMMERLLAAAGTRPAALDAVAFGAGPGSFTGLRIACGLAQGIAFGAGVPVLGVSTLEALAEETGAARVVACIDARMREVYYSALERHGNSWREVIAAQCVPPAAAPAPPGQAWTGCGSGFTAYAEALGEALRGKLEFVDVSAKPGAHAVARLAAPRLLAGEGVDAALAAHAYVRDKVALTTTERAVQ